MIILLLVQRVINNGEGSFFSALGIAITKEVLSQLQRIFPDRKKVYSFRCSFNYSSAFLIMEILFRTPPIYWIGLTASMFKKHVLEEVLSYCFLSWLTRTGLWMVCWLVCPQTPDIGCCVK